MRASPFEKVLIANRGEIALRIMRTARRLGIRTVAVYSDVDKTAPHADAADQAVRVGESLPTQSYLRIDSIIAAARASGADAVHPGYGFLAENAEFARACAAANLVFIGPSPQAMEAMGNKAGAKRRMIEAGVPCVPGYQGEQDAERLQSEAASIGFPVMIKAVAGGGGRGMRLVAGAGEFRDALRSAKSEAKSAFGDGDVLLERALLNPRHIEIQIFADRYGNAIHLGERDCSVQRRHQKIVEEAPSPAVSPQLRAQMGAAAVNAALAIGYEGAGTLEFLLDQEGNWFFMEMNTRLQVEHPVTEAITGLDLVEWQFRIAAGEPLPLKQEQIDFKGHAIEVRLCAEDPDRDFMPRSGQMRLWRAPDHVRVEHALKSGMDVPPYYDSMIAKLIAHGRTRDDARRRLAAALDDTVALGIATNRSFLARCLRDPTFVAGEATTGFIGSHKHQLLARDEGDDTRALVIAGLLMRLTDKDAWFPTALAPSFTVAARIEWCGRTYGIALRSLGDKRFSADLDDRTFELAVGQIEAPSCRVECNGVVESIWWIRHGGELHLQFRGTTYSLEDRTLSAAVNTGAARDGKIRASINGRVIAVHAAVGDILVAGQPVLTLEAMKMEHIHTAPMGGKVTAINASLNDQVAAARVIAEITPTAETA